MLEKYIIATLFLIFATRNQLFCCRINFYFNVNDLFGIVVMYDVILLETIYSVSFLTFLIAKI